MRNLHTEMRMKALLISKALCSLEHGLSWLEVV